MVEFTQSWKFMENMGLLYGNDIEEAVDRTKTENYAALNDEILLKYHTTLDCDLMLIGSPITQVGVLMRRGDPRE